MRTVEGGKVINFMRGDIVYDKDYRNGKMFSIEKTLPMKKRKCKKTYEETKLLKLFSLSNIRKFAAGVIPIISTKDIISVKKRYAIDMCGKYALQFLIRKTIMKKKYFC